MKISLRARTLPFVLLGVVAWAVGLAEVTTPLNHIYVTHRGFPGYVVTVKFFTGDGKLFLQRSDKVVGVGKRTYAYNSPVSKVELSVDSGSYHLNDTWLVSSVSYDHCILVKPNGAIVNTGDNRTGCEGE